MVVSGQGKACMHLPSNRFHFAIRSVMLRNIDRLRELVEALHVAPTLTLHDPVVPPRSHHTILLDVFLLLQPQRIKQGDWDQQSQQDAPDQ